MSEYWEWSEYERDAYIDEDQYCCIEFNIKVQLSQQKEISSSYYCFKQSKKNECELNNNNTILSVVAEFGGRAGQYTYKDNFTIDEGYALTDLSEYILHNALIDFIKLNLPYLYNTTILTFLKYCNEDKHYDSELGDEFARCCHNLFFVLNNIEIKNQLEDYLSIKYGVVNANVEINYKENGYDYFVYGPELEEREVWCVSRNRFFPSMNKELSINILTEVSKVYHDIDILMRGRYFYMMGGVKNIAVKFDNGVVKIEADIYQILTTEEEPIKDYQKVYIDIFDGLRGEYVSITDVKGIEDSVFVKYWLRSRADIAVYIAILSDEKLKADFNYAKAKWIKAAEIKYNTERQNTIICEQQALCKKFFKEQERMSFSHKIIEEFFKNWQFGNLYVHNDQYGAGIKESITNSYNMDILKVKFASGLEKTFMYPICFASTLTFINETDYINAVSCESIKK